MWRLAHTITLFTLATALRAGEVIALQWRDVSLVDATINIRRAIVRGRPTTPKSRAGTRTIHLGPETLTLVSQHYEHSRSQAYIQHTIGDGARDVWSHILAAPTAPRTRAEYTQQEGAVRRPSLSP